MRPIAALAFVVVLGACGFPPGRASLLTPHTPPFERRAPARSVIRFQTNRGDIVFEVLREWAPHGADRFVALVRHGFYDEARFFRVITDRFAQFGINGDPAVAKAWRYQAMPDDPFTQSNVHGTVAFAFAVPNGRTTQVFINLRDNSATFDREPFVPFGRVIEGLDVADSLNAEYGELSGGGIRAGHQGPLFEGGNAFLQREFPRLDYVVQATIAAR
jgi:cyclophilin family peptidyl-prolyl cis-trans isomerase